MEASAASSHIGRRKSVDIATQLSRIDTRVTLSAAIRTDNLILVRDAVPSHHCGITSPTLFR